MYRIVFNATGSARLANSHPFSTCMRLIKLIGFTKITYSTDAGMVTARVEDMTFDYHRSGIRPILVKGLMPWVGADLVKVRADLGIDEDAGAGAGAVKRKKRRKKLRKYRR